MFADNREGLGKGLWARRLSKFAKWALPMAAGVGMAYAAPKLAARFKKEGIPDDQAEALAAQITGQPLPTAPMPVAPPSPKILGMSPATLALVGGGTALALVMIAKK